MVFQNHLQILFAELVWHVQVDCLFDELLFLRGKFFGRLLSQGTCYGLNVGWVEFPGLASCDVFKGADKVISGQLQFSRSAVLHSDDNLAQGIR